MNNIVEVIWEDAWSESAGLRQEAIDNLEPIIRRNVGYLTKKDKKVVVLSAGVVEKGSGDSDTFSDNVVIPCGMIKQPIRYLKDNGNI